MGSGSSKTSYTLDLDDFRHSALILTYFFRQVPEITPSTRRTVSSRAIEEKASTFDEIFGDDQPRFVITVKGNAGERTVRERSDSFSEELHERLIDIKDERSTPSPTVDEEQSKDLFVGVENLLPGAKRGDRKRPKRADDPCELGI